MNKVLISLGSIFLLYGTLSLLGNFFGINPIYYVPFIAWFTALALFNLLLNNKQEKIFEYTKS